MFLGTISIAQDFNVAPAQQLQPKNKFRVMNLDLTTGLAFDRFPNMSLNHMMQFAENPAEIERDLTGMDENIENSASGLVLNANVAFSPLDPKTGDYSTKREIRLGLGLTSPKEAMVTYQSEVLDTSLVFCNLHGEFNVAGDYLFKGTWGKKERWNWFVGVGANVGASYGNEMILIPGRYYDPEEHPSEQPNSMDNMQTYQAKNVYYARAYVPYGLHYRFEEFSVGIECRRGLGIQKIEGSPANFMDKSSAFLIGMKIYQ